jgi:hypothetical protein
MVTVSMRGGDAADLAAQLGRRRFHGYLKGTQDHKSKRGKMEISVR